MQLKTSLLAAFTEADPTKLQQCAEAMSQLAASAQQVRDIPWDMIVEDINKINNIQPADSTLLDAAAVTRIIQASISIDYGGDEVAQELLSQDVIERTVKLIADAEDVKSALENLQLQLNTSSGTPQSQPNTSVSSTPTP